jgi:hypothetical protein
MIRSERGISLLESIPSNRTCWDALIADRFCSCFRQENISEAEFQLDTAGQTFQSTSQFILAQINSLTNSIRPKCRLYELDRIVSFKKLTINRINRIAVVLVFRPGEAWFETNLKMSEKRKSHRLILNGDPVRLSAYGNQSHCIKDSKLANYCYCTDL